MRIFVVALCCCAVIGCGGESKTPPPTEAAPKAARAKPSDESRRFPTANLTGTEVVDRDLMGKSFMPGGTLASYRKGKSEYKMFVAKAPTPNDAAMLLLDWKRAMSDAKFVASFGGYSGTVDGKPVFVFTKAEWIAGVSGLPQNEADLQARTLAGRL